MQFVVIKGGGLEGGGGRITSTLRGSGFMLGPFGALVGLKLAPRRSKTPHDAQLGLDMPQLGSTWPQLSRTWPLAPNLTLPNPQKCDITLLALFACLH